MASSSLTLPNEFATITVRIGAAAGIAAVFHNQHHYDKKRVAPFDRGYRDGLKNGEIRAIKCEDWLPESLLRMKLMTAVGKALTLKVGPPRPGLARVTPTQMITATNSNIRYLKSQPAQWSVISSGQSASSFLALQLVAPVLVMVLYGWKRRSEAPAQRAREARARQMKQARKRISSLPVTGDSLARAQGISEAFKQYLMASFGLAHSDLLDRQWMNNLASLGCDEADIKEAAEILRWTDMTRFGGGAPTDVSSERVLTLLGRLDQCAAV